MALKTNLKGKQSSRYIRSSISVIPLCSLAPFPFPCDRYFEVTYDLLFSPLYLIRHQTLSTCRCYKAENMFVYIASNGIFQMNLCQIFFNLCSYFLFFYFGSSKPTIMVTPGVVQHKQYEKKLTYNSCCEEWILMNQPFRKLSCRKRSREPQ